MKEEYEYPTILSCLMFVKNAKDIRKEISLIFSEQKDNQGQDKNDIAWGQLGNMNKRPIEKQTMKPQLPISPQRRMMFKLEKNMMVRKW